MQKPNIPEGRVRLCAIAAGFPAIKVRLEAEGIEVIEVDPHDGLQKPVASHADMQLHYLGQGRSVIAKYANKLKKSLEFYGITVQEEEVSAEYPNDIKLNCFSLKNCLFCKKESTSNVLLINYQSNEIEVIDIKQGYAKCSSCIVDEHSIITADKSIACAARGCGIDVLEISSGSILLDGYSEGFIGGCCGLIDSDRLAVCGNISQHTDYIAIKSFCAARGVKLVELADSQLMDIGGIIPLAIY